MVKEVINHIVFISLSLFLTGVVVLRLSVTIPHIVERNKKNSTIEQKDGYVLMTVTEK